MLEGCRLGRGNFHGLGFVCLLTREHLTMPPVAPGDGERMSNRPGSVKRYEAALEGGSSLETGAEHQAGWFYL